MWARVQAASGLPQGLGFANFTIYAAGKDARHSAAAAAPASLPNTSGLPAGGAEGMVAAAAIPLLAWAGRRRRRRTARSPR